MVVGAVILIAVTGGTLLTYGFSRAMKSTDRAQEPFLREPFRCGTPILQSGGTLIAQTGDMIEIITRDSTETMTVDEYNSRIEKQSEPETSS